MKNWDTLEPDVYRLMNKHFTRGRGGRKIRYLVRHHTAGVLTTDQVWNVWQDRQASAHYIVEPSGRIGQLVNDWDTAWANGNATANAESITIEHSNSAGPGQDWPISDATIEEGAHLAAALCRGYNLGRPEFGKNIRDHREFYGTSCPYHLARGGKYHQRYMDRAQYWYDHMTNPTPEEGITVSEADRIIEFIQAYLGPNNSDTKDIRFQLTGSRDMIPGDPQASYPGFEQLGQNSEGANLTVTDALAAVRRDIANLGKRLDRIEGKR